MKKLILLCGIALLAIASCKKETLEDKMYKYEVTVLDSAVQVYNPTNSKVDVSISQIAIGSEYYAYQDDYSLSANQTVMLPFSYFTANIHSRDSIVYSGQSIQACIWWYDANPNQANTNFSKSCSK